MIPVKCLTQQDFTPKGLFLIYIGCPSFTKSDDFNTEYIFQYKPIVSLIYMHIINFPIYNILRTRSFNGNHFTSLCFFLSFFVENVTINESIVTDGPLCSPRTIENFPQGLFTDAQRRSGAVAVGLLVALYMFGALAVVCDTYFMPSIEIICDGKTSGGNIHNVKLLENLVDNVMLLESRRHFFKVQGRGMWHLRNHSF